MTLDINNKKSIMHFQFLDKDFWNIIDDKKRVPIIQNIYDIIIDKGYFKKDINDDKFKKLKLKIQSKHTKLYLRLILIFIKIVENSEFDNFLNKQR